MLFSRAKIDMTVSAPQLGKTMMLAEWLLAGAWTDAGRVPWPSWWTAPTYEQARHGFLNYLVAMARRAGILEGRPTTQPPLKMRLINGSIIEAKSWDNYEGLYGPTVARIASDEFGYLTPEAAAAMSSRMTESALRGLGYWRLAGNVSEVGGEAEAMWRLAADEQRPGWSARCWTWRHRAEACSCRCGDFGLEIPVSLFEEQIALHGPRCERGLYLGEIATRRAKMSLAQFRQLYEAEWLDWSKNPTYEFDRAVHVTRDLRLDPYLPLDLACDFNVAPMAWVVGQHNNREAWALDEISLDGGATTMAACDEFLKRFLGSATQELWVFGDASGKSRSTKSTKSDYQIIREKLLPKWPRLRFMVPESNPPVTDRVNSVNAMLRSADQQVRYRIHQRCTRLANDYARVSTKPGTRDLDKGKDKNLTHFSDADGYRLYKLFPVRRNDKSSVRGGVYTPRHSLNPAFGAN